MKTVAQKMLKAKQIKTLWTVVDFVEKTADGDIYTYMDGSKLIVNAADNKQGFKSSLFGA